jgi:hypothetical protein
MVSFICPLLGAWLKRYSTWLASTKLCVQTPVMPKKKKKRKEKIFYLPFYVQLLSQIVELLT